jgi:thioredoxin 1
MPCYGWAEEKNKIMESFNQLIQSDQPVLVDFFATWCGPCKAMEPVIKEVAQLAQGKARIVKVDIDKQTHLAQAYNVQAVPTFMIFKKGTAVWRHPGMIDKNSLLNQLMQHV